MTETAPQLQPLYLLADSQLLFWKRQDRLLLEAALDGLARDTPLNAAYIGASNGERAQLIVLAGGDVRLGWTTFKKTGMKDVILGRYAQGAVLVGISAGAIQLGRYGIVEIPKSPATELLDVFKLVPVVIDTHDERAEWARLSRTIHLLEGAATGLGIPSGGGVIVHADTTIEALRRPAHEFRFESTRVTHSLLCAEEGN